MKKEAMSVGQFSECSHSKAEDGSRRSTHVYVEKSGAVRHLATNGRLIGPSLVDPGMHRKIKEATKQLFPDRDAVIRHFAKRGMLTKTGRLTKAYGGG